MFKNATIYRLTKAEGNMAEAMEAQKFTPLGASTQDRSVGWVPPRAEHGALLEPVSGFLFAKLAIETKSVPASEVRKTVDAAVEQIEQATGRKPGKKERNQLKEDAVLALLPKAFPKRKDINVMIDREHGYVIMDASSQSAADDVASALVCAGLELSLVQTMHNVNGFMAQHLIEGDVAGSEFYIGRECELVAPDETKAKVTFKNHHLLTQEIQDHLTQGKLVTKLAMSCECEGIETTFVLTENLQLKKLKFAVPQVTTEEKADAFDADATLTGHALSALVANLVSALGGLFEQPAEEASKKSNPPDGELYDKAVEIVMQEQRASISLIQRHLKIGYNAAARLLEQMETNGLVSPMQPDGMRKILESA